MMNKRTTEYKAAFFDIDGTLVSFKTHMVPESTRQAIETLRANGVKCFIASGRHMSNIDNLGSLEFDGYITVNGGMTYLDGQLIDKNPINPEDVATVLNIMYGENINESTQGIEPFAVSFVQRNGLVLNWENEKTEQLFRQLNFGKVPTQDDLRHLVGEDVFQMISFFGTEVEPRMMEVLPHCQSARWSPLFTDLVPKGQSKVRGIDIICNHMGINISQAMAFGDGGNDIEMLTHVGMGVAMGNAADEVKREARMVCPSVDCDGIATAVANIL